MAGCQLDSDEIVAAAKFSEVHAEEPRYLLDELVARKLSALSAGETSLGYFLTSGRSVRFRQAGSEPISR